MLKQGSCPHTRHNLILMSILTWDEVNLNTKSGIIKYTDTSSRPLKLYATFKKLNILSDFSVKIVAIRDFCQLMMAYSLSFIYAFTHFLRRIPNFTLSYPSWSSSLLIATSCEPLSMIQHLHNYQYICLPSPFVTNPRFQNQYHAS